MNDFITELKLDLKKSYDYRKITPALINTLLDRELIVFDSKSYGHITTSLISYMVQVMEFKGQGAQLTDLIVSEDSLFDSLDTFGRKVHRISCSDMSYIIDFCNTNNFCFASPEHESLIIGVDVNDNDVYKIEDDRIVFNSNKVILGSF